MKVFVMEDSVLMSTRIVQAALGVTGVVIAGTAANVGSALAGIRQTTPDALVVDIQLADGNGLTVLRDTKLDRPDIRSIVLTNSANETYRRVAIKAGADHVLDKSTEFFQLPQILSDWSAHFDTTNNRALS
jgi:DNA-binding NarL/FixJ family response regulator